MSFIKLKHLYLNLQQQTYLAESYEVVGYSVGSKLALLRVQEWLLLEWGMSVTLEVNRGPPCCDINFVPSSPQLKHELAELFIASSNWMYSCSRYRTRSNE